MKRIPQTGIVGEAALREAAATELRAIIDLVRAAVIAKVYPGQPDRHLSVEAMYADRVVVMQEGRLWAYPYTLGDDNQVSVGEPVEVVLDHKPVKLREAQGAFIEGKDGAGLTYLIRVVRAGLSGNKNYYPDAVLREAAPLFDGARVFVKSDEEHIKGGGKAFEKLVGRLIAPAFIEGQAPDTGEIRATLELLAASGVPAKLREAWDRGMADLFGFSIDVEGQVKVAARGGVRVREAVKFIKVNSVDLIIEPGAGGQIIKLIEALNEESTDMKLRERMIEAVKQAHDGKLPDGLNVEDDEALSAAYREALAQNTARRKPEGAAAAAAAAQAGAVTQEQLDARLRLVEARAYARATLAGCHLPQAAKDKLARDFDARERFTEADVDTAIKAEREYLARFTESGRVTGLGGESFIEAGEDRSEKVAKMLDAFFDANNRDVISFKECYVEITGDRRVTGRLEDCDPRRLREAMPARLRESLDSASLGNVLGNAIRRSLIADYRQNNRYDVWRDLVGTPVPAVDFRTNERTRYGGYGDLPIVGQSQPYGALASPSDEKATYAVAKRGGTEDMTLEMIKNDDVGVIRSIPVRLSRAAKRTLSKFVLDFLATNPVIYDGLAVFHATHGNLGTSTLGAPTLAAARLSVLKQTELNSADRIGIPPVKLWVPFDLEETAFDLFRRQTNNETDFVESLQMKVIPVWYWSDANNWFTTCDPVEVPAVEIAFLDGAEEPEIFVQDNPAVGSMFSHDKLTWKIRHIYGGNWLEYRGAYGAIVA